MFHPATAGRPRFDIADIVRRHRVQLEQQVQLTTPQRRVLSAIALCRTAALGGHLDVCRACGFEHPAYNSCRNRHCPKCQAMAQERWIAARSERLLPIGHFHVVFTLPSELRKLAQLRPAAVFDALFRAAVDTLLELGRTRLGANMGATMVLHTWTRELHLHPHVHAIVTAGGMALDGTSWIASSTQYLFPVRVMGALLRGKMMAALRRLNARGEFKHLLDFADPEAFDRLMVRLVHRKWVVYAKKPFCRSEHVLAYLGRYTHRVGIANSRLVEITDQVVVFRTRGDATATVTPIEFLQRFVQHVLPAGMQKIRHYGLYAGAHAHGLLSAARDLIDSPPNTTKPETSKTSVATWKEDLLAIDRGQLSCPRCGQLMQTLVFAATARAPPAAAAP